MPYDAEGDAGSLTAQRMLITAFAVQSRQTIHLNYRSPQISGLKINQVMKNGKSCTAQIEKKAVKDTESDSQTVTQKSVSVFCMHQRKHHFSYTKNTRQCCTLFQSQ